MRPARRRFLPWSASPATRVAVGLVALMLSILLLSDFFVRGFMPNPQEETQRYRALAGELIGTQVAHALRGTDEAALPALLGAAVRRDQTLLSARVVVNGSVRATTGEHDRSWHLPADAPSTLDNLRLPILAAGKPWGELQLAFVAPEPLWPWGWTRQPMLLGTLLMAGLGLIAFYLYIRRTMRYLDPSAAVPERVRTAFDTLTEAVLVLDNKAHIMLANRAFLSLGPSVDAELTGAAATSLDWLMHSLAASQIEPPWERTLADQKPRLDVHLRIADSARGPRELLMNSSPINDGFGRLRGCLVTFSDVTQLHERTRQLRATIADLEITREEIARKNEELTLLATRDPLTGCLNRRAFMQMSQRALEVAQAADQPLCSIMCDIDHFKSINDRFGHAGGDEVLKAVARALARGLRTGDLLGRYGGEEFCILLPDATLEQALQIAERLRSDVAANAGNAVRQYSELKVTMSFGVEQLGGRAQNYAALVDLADQALYHSKKTGRNRVTAYSQMPRPPVALVGS